MATDPRFGMEGVRAITGSTLVPLGVGVGALVVAVQLTWNVSQAVSAFRYEIKAEIADLRRDLKEQSQNRWSETDQLGWASELQQENPGKIKVPKPTHRE
jgi:hypothetical protein